MGLLSNFKENLHYRRSLIMFDQSGKTIRPELTEFAIAMEMVLRKHDNKKKDTWKKIPEENLRLMLMTEVYEFIDSKDKNELIDVANICMMLFMRGKK